LIAWSLYQQLLFKTKEKEAPIEKEGKTPLPIGKTPPRVARRKNSTYSGVISLVLSSLFKLYYTRFASTVLTATTRSLLLQFMSEIFRQVLYKEEDVYVIEKKMVFQSVFPLTK
jgi:uncharacterized membrane protein